MYFHTNTFFHQFILNLTFICHLVYTAVACIMPKQSEKRLTGICNQDACDLYFSTPLLKLVILS